MTSGTSGHGRVWPGVAWVHILVNHDLTGANSGISAELANFAPLLKLDGLF